MGDWISITKDSGHKTAINLDEVSHVDEDTDRAILYFTDNTKPQTWPIPSGEVTALKSALAARI